MSKEMNYKRGYKSEKITKKSKMFAQGIESIVSSDVDDADCILEAKYLTELKNTPKIKSAKFSATTVAHKGRANERRKIVKKTGVSFINNLNDAKKIY